MASSKTNTPSSTNLLSIPSTLFYHSIFPHLQTSNLLALRIACRGCHHLLHNTDDDEVEQVWIDALVRDFHFTIPSSPSSSQSPSPSISPECHYLDTIRVVSSERRMSDESEGSNESSKSVFGCTASNAIIRAENAFESWKNWKEVARRFFEKPSSSSEASDSSSALLDSQISLHGPYFLRAAKLWSKIEQWCDSPESKDVGHRIKQSFMPGLSHYEWCTQNRKFRKTFEAEGDYDDGGYGVAYKRGRGLWALQALYAFYGGQDSPTDQQSIFRGLLGGFSAYNNIICTGLLSLDDINGMSLVERFGPHHGGDSFIPIASSFNHRHVFEINISTGHIYLFNSPRHMFAIPPLHAAKTEQGGITFVNEFRHDAVLVWMEEYTSRLTGGLIGVERMFAGEPVTEAVVLYPTIKDQRTFIASAQQQERVPAVSRAVTRGIEVVASSVYAPDARMHVYSLRIKLLTPNDEGYVSPEERGFQTCQLRSRHWQIMDHDENSMDEVQGDGVIGLYPLLREGGYRNDSGIAADELFPAGTEMEGAFQYQSCSGPVRGSFGGWIRFVPGSLDRPQGDGFDVRVAPFALISKPDFLF